jgi:hypothetical protein
MHRFKTTLSGFTLCALSLVACTGSDSSPTAGESLTPPAFTPSKTPQTSANPNEKLANAINPCALVTDQDLRDITGSFYAVMGHEVSGAPDLNSTCVYGSPNATLKFWTLVEDKKAWDEFVEGNEAQNKGKHRPVGGLGDAAFSNADTLLAVRDKELVMGFESVNGNTKPPSLAQLKQLATRALLRANM